MKLRRLELLDGPPPPPRWIADGLIERGTVTLVSGDTGAGKSLLVAALAGAVVRDDEWIGRSVEQGNVAYCDEEMVDALALARLWALGLRAEHGDRLFYSCRAGLQLDDDEHYVALCDALDELRRGNG